MQSVEFYTCFNVFPYYEKLNLKEFESLKKQIILEKPKNEFPNVYIVWVILSENTYFRAGYLRRHIFANDVVTIDTNLKKVHKFESVLLKQTYICE